MKVPFLDFVGPYEELKAELDEAWSRFMRSAWYVLGRAVRGIAWGWGMASRPCT